MSSLSDKSELSTLDATVIVFYVPVARGGVENVRRWQSETLFINSTLYKLPCARQYELTDHLRMRSRKHGQQCDCAGHLHNLCRGRKFILNVYGFQWHIMKKVKTQV